MTALGVAAVAVGCLLAIAGVLISPPDLKGLALIGFGAVLLLLARIVQSNQQHRHAREATPPAQKAHEAIG